MARSRLIKPGFFANVRLSEISPHGRLLFAGLWTLADREGRLLDEPRFIKGQLFPYESVPVPKLLGVLAAAGFIRRYIVAGVAYIQIENFLKHQTPHVREPASTIPAPPETDPSTGLAQGQHQSSPASRARDPVSVSDPVPKTETETETGASAELPAGFKFYTEPPVPDDPGFVGEYQRQYELREGKHPPAAHLADARRLERDFGAAACLDEAADLNWEKHPNYLRKRLEKSDARERMDRDQASGSGSANGTGRPGGGRSPVASRGAYREAGSGPGRFAGIGE